MAIVIRNKIKFLESLLDVTKSLGINPLQNDFTYLLLIRFPVLVVDMEKEL